MDWIQDQADDKPELTDPVGKPVLSGRELAKSTVVDWVWRKGLLEQVTYLM
jgi:hypothetical protein